MRKWPRLIGVVTILLVGSGCDSETGECSAENRINLQETENARGVADCSSDGEHPISITIDREAERVIVEYEREREDGTVAHVKQTWRIVGEEI